jgi:hypothetical protein
MSRKWCSLAYQLMRDGRPLAESPRYDLGLELTARKPREQFQRRRIRDLQLLLREPSRSLREGCHVALTLRGKEIAGDTPLRGDGVQ